jgi:predicted Zn-dependent protease
MKYSSKRHLSSNKTARSLLTAVCVLAASLLGSAAYAQSDAAKALGGLFQNLVRPAAPAAPAATPANALGGLLGVQIGNGQKQGVNAGDLITQLTQSLEDIDEPKEIEIGRQLASVLLGAKPLHPNMALQRYVNRLGRWISLQSSRPDLPWTFAVLDDPGFNAFAAPGGYVFVTKGLVDQLQDESELAAILAHEITHVVGKHHLKAIRKTARAGLLGTVVASQLKNDAGGALSSQLLGLGREVYAKGLDQEDEFEADRLGVSLATRAGFDPYGLVAVLLQLRTAAPDNPMFSLALSTHPPTQSRLDHIELAMGQTLDAYAGKPAITIAQRMARSVGR